MKKLFQTILLLLSITFSFSCKKYLDQKPDKKLSTATSLDDCEALLDDNSLVNSYFPNEPEISSDNYISLDDYLNAMPEYARDYYVWKGNVQNGGSWMQLYKLVAYANLVLEGMKDITPTHLEVSRYNNVLGNAYFLRGFSFFALSQIYAPPFGEKDPLNNMGIPLRLTSDVTKASVRSSIFDSYRQIVSDLKLSTALLSVDNKFKTRGNKPAAYATLSRVFLSMSNFDSAKYYAQRCLEINSSILDFRQLDVNAFGPIQRFNTEVLFHSQSQPEVILQFGLALVDTNLMKEYSDYDLRKSIFYYPLGDGTYSYKGGYDGAGNGNIFVFGGLATDEVYLTLAECLAREGKVDSSMTVLNKLLVNRYESGKFTNRTAANKEDALTMILAERRKELVFRGTRWTDLRRLRKDPNNAVIPKRVVNGTTYELLPDSKRYTMLLPAEVINLGGLPQNP